MSSAVKVAMVASGVKSPAAVVNMKGEHSDKTITKVDNKTILIGALGTAGICLTTYAAPTHALSDVAALATTAFTPYVVHQKKQLANLGSFREVQNELRATANDVAEENNILAKNVNLLESSVDKLEDLEKKLSKLANTDNVPRLVEAVKQMKYINEQIKKRLQSRISQDIITTVLRCDRNGDLVLNKNEMFRLTFRLKNDPQYTFNEKRFKEVIGDEDHANGYSIGKIMQVIRNLLDDDVSTEECIFHFKP